MKDVQEIVFYIHGVSSDADGGEHPQQYQTLHDGIRGHMTGNDWPDDFKGAEWGWQFDGGESKSHRALATAQLSLSTEVLELLDRQSDFTLNPTRAVVNGLREIMLFGFADIFFYVSEDGKRAIRRTISDQLLEFIKLKSSPDSQLSLTLIGHSAGSTMAFDFLYYLFSQRSGHEFLASSEENATLEGLDALKQLVHEKKLRLRRLVTMGAPISMTAFRSDALVEIFARGERLRPVDYGLESTLNGLPDLEGPRWINIWDKDDPISFPIAPIMNSPLAQDVYVDVSDFVSDAHTVYWESPRVHRTIASMW